MGLHPVLPDARGPRSFNGRLQMISGPAAQASGSC